VRHPAQASTLVIRALALSEVTPRDWWKVMRRFGFGPATSSAPFVTRLVIDFSVAIVVLRGTLL
jgi:Mg/Co/Ni transporter MgtE